MPCPKILLVEDDPAIRTLMVTWLDTAGYDVRTASNGREALVRLREAPCLMVVDLNMPLMDGAELRRQQLQMPGLSAMPSPSTPTGSCASSCHIVTTCS
jgi:CheY-like chemotaxis protein